MSFLQDSGLLLYASEKYDDIYMRINREFKISYKNIFLLCATLGARKGVRLPLEKRGREFRGTYLNEEEEQLAYVIILNDEKSGKNIEALNDPEFRVTGRNKLQEYAEGGMSILVDNVFNQRWNGLALDPRYDDYGVDIMKYLVAELNQVPF
jgi:hypothetical protein